MNEEKTSLQMISEISDWFDELLEKQKSEVLGNGLEFVA